MSLRVQWARGGEASIVSIAANAIVLRSTVPAPPGSRIDGTVSAHGTAIMLRVKVHASHGDETGEFVLHGRPLDMTRDARERLEAMVRVREE